MTTRSSRYNVIMSRRMIASVAIALLGGGLWLLLYAPAQAQIERGGPAPTRTPVPPTLSPGTTPTPDRLAPPPTVPSPTQADEGAQLFWLHCQPCHGDRGQGLTDEWRAQYPPEEEYCWESGCHGNQPYDEAFALPTRVPAVIDAAPTVTAASNSVSRPVSFDTAFIGLLAVVTILTIGGVILWRKHAR